MDNGCLLISVIITVYNTEKYLCECLDSVIRQKVNGLEIVIVDDGSEDQSPGICDKYGSMDSRIKVIHQENKGMIEARKSGLAAARGKYISFIDSDDYVDEDMYENAVREIQKYGEPDCVVFGLKEIYENRTRIKSSAYKSGFYESQELREIYSGLLCSGDFFSFGILPNLVVKLVKRELFDVSGFFDIDKRLWYGEDVCGSMLLMSAVKSLLITDGCPYNYRQSNYTNGLKTINVTVEDLCVLCREIKKAAGKFPQPEVFDEQIKMYMFFVILLRQYDKIAAQYSDYLFPFKEIKKESDIVLYGAGQFGIAVYKYLAKTHFCNTILWVDSNAGKAEKRSLPVKLPEEIKNARYDHIFITILDQKTAESVKEKLIAMGIEEDKILFIGRELISRLPLPDWLE